MLGHLINCNKVFSDILMLNGNRSTVIEVFDPQTDRFDSVLCWEKPTLP